MLHALLGKKQCPTVNIPKDGIDEDMVSALKESREYIADALKTTVPIADEQEYPFIISMDKRKRLGNIRHLYSGPIGSEGRERLFDFPEKISPEMIEASPAYFAVRNALQALKSRKNGFKHVGLNEALEVVHKTAGILMDPKKTSVDRHNMILTHYFFEELRDHSYPSEDAMWYVVE